METKEVTRPKKYKSKGVQKHPITITISKEDREWIEKKYKSVSYFVHRVVQLLPDDFEI